MARKKQKVEFRFYEIPEKEVVLALLGEDWIRSYGEGIDYLHFHNFMEIGVCHYGSGEVVLGEKHYEFQDDSIVIIPPKLPHTTNSKPGTQAFWEWMYFDVETILDEMYPQEPLIAAKLKDKIYENSLYFSASLQPIMQGILHRIMQEMQQKRYLYAESVKGLLHTFIVELLRIRADEEQMSRKQQKTLTIAPAIEYVEEHFAKEIKISQLAQACSISESHFRRIFLESMNMKPLDYVNLVRIQQACAMMKKTEKPMETVAYQVGFENVSTFNRNFKKIMGISPYQWKKSADNYEGKLLNYRISAQKGW